MSLLDSALNELGASNNGPVAKFLRSLQVTAGNPAQKLVFPLTAAQINAAVLPHTFILGGFSRMYLVTGIELLVSGAGFVMPGKTLTFDSLVVGSAALAALPHAIGSSTGVDIPENFGSVTVDVTDDVELRISSNNAAAIASGFLEVFVYAVPLV